MPTVSIGLPVYNGEGLLRAAVDSYLAQTYEDFELIICDNASTDGTEQICRDYAASDPRVKYHRNAINVGAADNFRRAFELSSCSYFKWAAVDDYCDPRYLERIKPLLDRNPDAVVACSGVYIVDGEGARHVYPQPQALMQDTPSERFIANFSVDTKGNAVYGLMRAQALRQTPVMGRYPGSDLVLMAELVLHGKIVEDPEPLFFRGVHEQASTYDFTFEKQQQFYNPSKSTRLVYLYLWRLLLEYAKAAWRVPIGTGERLRIMRELGRMMRWKRRELAAELGLFVRSFLPRFDKGGARQCGGHNSNP